MEKGGEEAEEWGGGEDREDRAQERHPNPRLHVCFHSPPPEALVVSCCQIF